MLSKLRSTLVCTIALLITAATHAQNTIHVPADQPTIQAGINAANTGDTVLVAPGTYYENIDFKGKAITVTSTTGAGGGAANTIIDGGGNGPAVTFKRAETRAAVLSGMTVTHGGINTPSLNYNAGPGISIMNGQPTLLNNIITQNYCLGIYSYAAAPLLQGNVISYSLNPDKCDVSSGAGIFLVSDYVPVLGQSTIIPASIIGNIIENNSAGEDGEGGGDGGAGIYVQGGSPLIQNNIIRNNEALSGNGGGIYVAVSGVTIFQNLIYGNDAGCGGGGITFEGGTDAAPFYILIANNTIVNNTGDGDGGYSNCQKSSQLYALGDLYGGSGPSALLVNNIISGATSYPAINCSEFGAYSEVTQPLFDHNLLYNADGPFFGNYCVDTSAKYGNVVAPPQLVDPTSNNYQLLSTSPAIDHGNTSVLQSVTDFSGAQITHDFAGNLRLQDATGVGYPIIDMGAYEYAGVADAQPTTIVLTSSAYTGNAGSNYTLTATLASPAGVPTGAVTFSLDGKQIGVTMIVNNGIATLNNVLLTPGLHSLYATYPGQGSFTPATSVVIIVDISFYGPSLSITSAPNPSYLGQSVKFNVTITSPDTNQLGPIVVSNTNTDTTLATLNPDASGNASFSTSSLPLGYNNIQAYYAGDSTHTSASALIQQQVISASATTTTLTSSLNPSSVGQAVTFTATVTGTGTPTGSITFADGGTTLATVTLGGTTGIATYTTSALAANDPGTTPSHSITATYNPTGSFATSSASLSQVVNGLPTTDTLTVSPPSGTTTTSFTATATIQPNAPGPSPTGQVIFSVTIPPSTVAQPQTPVYLPASGMVAFTFSNLPSSAVIGCTYNGDSTYASSTCNTVPVTITPAVNSTTTTTLAITAAGSPVTSVAPGTVVTLTATTLAGASPVTPGVINFCDAAAPACTDIHLIGTAQLTASGTAVLRFIPGPGTHSYKAVFLGTHADTTSSSAAASLTVGSGTSNASTTSLSFIGSPGNYTLTATVSGSLNVPPTGNVSFLDTTNANYVLGTASLSPFAGGISLLNSSTIPVDTGPLAVVTADFNGDGIPDIATSGTSVATVDPPGTVTILLGKGDGTFSQSSTITTPPYPYYLVVGDFNNDGVPDLAFTSTRTPAVTIEFGNGDGTFRAGPTTSVGLQSGALATADFNGDGNADLAILTEVNYGSPQVLSILLGNGDGTFSQSPTPLQLSDLTITIKVGDFNLDGKPDLAITSGQDATGASGSVSILLGNGDGTFSAGPALATGSDPNSLAIADLNGDGKPDIAVVDELSGDLSVFLGKGDGTFPTSTRPSAGFAPGAVSAADVNGDGKVDLVISPVLAGEGNILLLIGNGDGTFSTVTGPLTGINPWSNAVADFNGDGLDDIAVSESFSNEVNIYLTQLGGSTATATVTNISPVGTGTHLVDASYPGDSTYAASLSNTVSLTAQRVPTTVALTIAVAPSGGPITLTAALSPNFAQNHSATGPVAFFSNGNTLGTANVANGVATLSIASLPLGVDALLAQYAGDTNFAPSSGTGSITIAPSAPPDFTLTGPQTITFRTESTGTATLSLASLNGFAAPISITCNAPLPPNYLCSLSTSTVSLAANGTASFNLKLHPNVNAALTSPSMPGRQSGLFSITLAAVFPITLFALYRRKTRTFASSLVALFCLGALTTLLSACGSDVYTPATPPGIYPITVTATGTNQGSATATTHTVTVNANITP